MNTGENYGPTIHFSTARSIIGNMTRRYCPRCHYPQSTCACAVARTISSETPIDILQHPSETHAAKNTARLAAYCLPECRIWHGENENDFLELRRELRNETRTVFLLYPSDGSVDIRALSTVGTNKARLLILDGTWRKAYKMYQLNPWLYTYPTVTICDQTSNYTFRKAPNKNCLSTLESVQYALTKTEPELDLQPLSDCLDHLKECFSRRD